MKAPRTLWRGQYERLWSLVWSPQDGAPARCQLASGPVLRASGYEFPRIPNPAPHGSMDAIPQGRGMPRSAEPDARWNFFPSRRILVRDRRRRHASNRADRRGQDFLLSALRSALFGDASTLE